MELHLEDLSPDELMEKSRSDGAADDGAWRREAYVQHLVSLDQVNAKQSTIWQCYSRL